MARIWFVRRRGAQWIAPGGKPVHEAPLAELIFSLDLGPQRWLESERPIPVPDLCAEDSAGLTKVIVETSPADLSGRRFGAYRVGFYDSPFRPEEAARRLRL